MVDSIHGDGDPVVVGVDGGGTSTRVVLCGLDGTVLGSGMGGSGNLHDVGEVVLRANISQAFEEAWRVRGQSPRPGVAAVLAMASVGTGGNRETVRRIAREIGLAGQGSIRVDIDLVAALAGGLGGEPGIALIAGTGSSCFGRDLHGTEVQVGGWGSLLDDVGGATWIGTQAMVAAIRAFDGRGAATLLEQRIMDHFGLGGMRELLPKVDAEAGVRASRAQLARLVTESAAAGDLVASGILAVGADALAECVGAAHHKLGFGSGPVPVVVTGGLAENVPEYRAMIHNAVRERVPTAMCVAPVTSNAAGAVLEALRDALGERPSSQVAARVVQTA